MLSEKGKPRPSNLTPLFCTTIKLLCTICTIQKNPYYVPGETHLQERLRKRSFDSGCFSVLQHIFNELKDEDASPFCDLKRDINDGVLRHADINDLVYYQKVLGQFQIIQEHATTQTPFELEGRMLQSIDSNINGSSEFKYAPEINRKQPSPAVSRVSKKTSLSPLMQLQVNAASAMNTHTSETAKLLGSNDKVSVKELWQEEPLVDTKDTIVG